jgi:putative transposase
VILGAASETRAANAVRLFLLTGSRLTDVRKATWKLLDMERGVWTKPSHHTKQERIPHLPLSALSVALVLGRPEIFNTDRGCQFTSTAFTHTLERQGVRISMDSKDRFSDNIFVQRLWHSVRYEEFYLHAYHTGAEVQVGLARYSRF